MKIILVGNANCGKTTIFNALTGANEKTGNWHGVTVGMKCKQTKIFDKTVNVCDLPGIYSLNTHSLEEKITKTEIEKGEYDIVVAVADAVTLKRSLQLPLEIAKSGKKIVLIVTMADVLKKQGGFIDGDILSEKLGFPVVIADPRARRDILKIKNAIFEAESCKNNTFERSNDINDISDAYFEGTHISGKSDFILYNPITAYTLFVLIMLATFFLAFANGMPGVFLTEKIEFLINDLLGGIAVSVLNKVGAHPAIVSLVKDALFNGSAMLLSFIPQIAILQAVLLILEESGYMASLAFMTDGIFSKVGLSGRAVFSVLMGFGCSAAAILSTRGLENKDIQKRTVLILSYVSCSAKMPVYLAVISAFFYNKFAVLCAVYLAGVLISFFVAFLLKKFSKETEFILEIPHLQFPKISLLFKSLLFYVKQFIIKIATVVTAFLIVMWFLLSFDFTLKFVGQGNERCIMRYFCEGLKYLFYPMGIKDWRIALSAVSGLIAKESVAGMLSMFYGSNLSSAFSPEAALSFIAFVLTATPCVSAIAATAKEFGKRRAIKYALIQSCMAFLAGYAVYFMLKFGTIAVILITFAATFIVCFNPSKTYNIKRKINNRFEKIYRNGKSKT